MEPVSSKQSKAYEDYEHDMSFQEIGDLMGMSDMLVRIIFLRAMDKLHANPDTQALRGYLGKS